ncbi:MAG: S49 family peptidase [Gammaproteobacteria bacterium]
MSDKERSGSILPDNDGGYRDIVERLAFTAVNEQRRARRWSIFFKILLALYLLALLIIYLPRDWSEVASVGEKHTALVELTGIISDSTEASADIVIGGLRDAFEDKKTAGVILRANSPGGSPVQSSYIYQEIQRLRELHPETKLYAVVTDMCASGCYYVVSAADEIYVNKSSIVGSIGVRMDSFGFVDTLEKLGVERRLYTAGESKGFLDPFLPSKEADVEHIQRLLGDIHEHFKTAVRDGRGDKLKEAPQLFTGLIWTGEEGVDMGLVDDFGSAGYVAREIIGAEDIVDFTREPDLLELFTERIGMAMARAMGRVMVEATGTIK